jgi:hypothetical protein
MEQKQQLPKQLSDSDSDDPDFIPPPQKPREPLEPPNENLSPEEEAQRRLRNKARILDVRSDWSYVNCGLEYEKKPNKNSWAGRRPRAAKNKKKVIWEEPTKYPDNEYYFYTYSERAILELQDEKKDFMKFSSAQIPLWVQHINNEIANECRHKIQGTTQLPDHPPFYRSNKTMRREYNQVMALWTDPIDYSYEVDLISDTMYYNKHFVTDTLQPIELTDKQWFVTRMEKQAVDRFACCEAVRKLHYAKKSLTALESKEPALPIASSKPCLNKPVTTPCTTQRQIPAHASFAGNNKEPTGHFSSPTPPVSEEQKQRDKEQTAIIQSKQLVPPISSSKQQVTVPVVVGEEQCSVKVLGNAEQIVTKPSLKRYLTLEERYEIGRADAKRMLLRERTYGPDGKRNLKNDIASNTVVAGCVPPPVLRFTMPDTTERQMQETFAYLDSFRKAPTFHFSPPRPPLSEEQKKQQQEQIAINCINNQAKAKWSNLIE